MLGFIDFSDGERGMVEGRTDGRPLIQFYVLSEYYTLQNERKSNKSTTLTALVRPPAGQNKIATGHFVASTAVAKTRLAMFRDDCRIHDHCIRLSAELRRAGR